MRGWQARGFMFSWHLKRLETEAWLTPRRQLWVPRPRARLSWAPRTAGTHRENTTRDCARAAVPQSEDPVPRPRAPLPEG